MKEGRGVLREEAWLSPQLPYKGRCLGLPWLFYEMRRGEMKNRTVTVQYCKGLYNSRQEVEIMLFRFKAAHGIRHELSQAKERGTDCTDYPSLTRSFHFRKGFLLLIFW